MKASLTTPLFLSSFWLAVPAAHAQVHFSAGPQVGLSLASAHFTDSFYTTSYRPGLEAGVRASIGYGHLAVQPALLFSQKGYQQHTLSGTVIGEETHRLNYLTLPLDFTYTLRESGQGLQVVAGPYVGLLLGGHYTSQTTYANGSIMHEGQVVAGGTKPDKYPFSPYMDTDAYSRRLDAGVQMGLGYRYGGLVVQAHYSVGLRNLAPYFEASLTDGPAYYTRSLQFSLAYLFGPRS